MRHPIINTIYDNPVSQALFKRYKSVNAFIDAYYDEYQDEITRRPYHQKVYAWIRRGRVPPAEAKRFVALTGARLEDII